MPDSENTFSSNSSNQKDFFKKIGWYTFRDEHEYSNIGIFKDFGAGINIRIRFHDKVNIHWSNTRYNVTIPEKRLRV